MFLRILFIAVLTLTSVSVFGGQYPKVPSHVNYIQEPKANTINSQNLIRLESLATEYGFEEFVAPEFFVSELVLEKENLKQAIMISANSRVNPEYNNKIFEHSDGFLIQVTSNGQQLAVFAFGMEAAVAEVLFNRLRDEKVSSNQAGNSRGLASEVRSSSASQVASRVGKEATQFGKRTVQCGVGIVQGTYDMVVGTVRDISLASYNFIRNPRQQWEIEKRAARRMADVRGLARSIGQNYDAMDANEKQRFICSIFGAPGVGTVATAPGRIARGTTRLGLATSISASVAKAPAQSLKSVARANRAASDVRSATGKFSKAAKLEDIGKLAKIPADEFTAQFKATTVAVYNKLNDRAAFSEYIKKLMNDADQYMRSSGKPVLVEAAKNGEISRNAVLAVLVQRARARGEKFATLNSGQDGAFMEKVGRGPFFDKVFKSDGTPGSHGMDAHLIQRDFVADVVTQKMDGKHAEYYRALSQGSGSKVWDAVYDNFDDSFTSPEFVTRVLASSTPVL